MPEWNASRFVSETARLIRRQPDLSDSAPRWGGLTTCRWTHPAHESSVPAMNAHFLAYHFGPRAHVGFRLNDGRYTSVWCDPGTCSYIPASLPVKWNLLTGMHVVNILIPDALVNEAREYARNEGTQFSVQRPGVGFHSRGLERMSILLVREIRRGGGHASLLAEDLTQKLCLEILAPKEKLPKGTARLTPAQTRRSIDLMHADLSERCDLQALSTAAGVSVFQFAHAFRNTVGTSPHEYLSRVRASSAKLLLTQSSQGVAEIGESIGFHSIASFTNFFHRRTGVSPTVYREAFAARPPVT